MVIQLRVRLEDIKLGASLLKLPAMELQGMLPMLLPPQVKLMLLGLSDMVVDQWVQWSFEMVHIDQWVVIPIQRGCWTRDLMFPALIIEAVAYNSTSVSC